MRITLIDPKGDQVGMNMGLAYLASSLIKAGHSVKVIDFNNYHKDEDNRLKAVYDADIIGFSIKSFTIEESNRLLKKVKLINPEARIVCGGAHISTDGSNFSCQVCVKEQPHLKKLITVAAEETIKIICNHGGENDTT